LVQSIQEKDASAMGVSGWNELQDAVTVQGFVVDDPHLSTGFLFDGDWCFSIRPTRGFSRFLVNSHNFINLDGTIECEIEPAQHLKDLGVDVVSNAVIDQFLGSPKGRWVTVFGTWVEDSSHDDKTEIHPITSLLVEQAPAPDNLSRIVDFVVFSDDSPHGPVPHKREDRHAAFEVVLPLGASFQKISELNAAASVNVSTQPSSRFERVRFEVASGKPEDLKGFYHVKLRLPGFTLLTFLLTRGLDPSKGVLETMRRAGVESVRALFTRLEAGALPPLSCAQLMNKMTTIQGSIDVLVHMIDVSNDDLARQSLRLDLSGEWATRAELFQQGIAQGCL
jgi:hypothetical protein